MRDQRTLLVASFVVATLVFVVAAFAAYQQWGPERRHELAASWAYDLANPDVVAGHADSVVIGRVVGSEGFSNRPPPSTTFRVQVRATIKGGSEQTLLVDQYGGRRGRDVWVLHDQTPLKVGASYVLAMTGSGNAVRTLIAGPASVTPVNESQLPRQLRAWRAHVAKHQQPDLPR